MAYRPYESGDMTEEEPASELASRGVRLAARVIDALIYFFVAVVATVGSALMFEVEFAFIPLALVTSAFILLLLLALLLVVFSVQMVLLATRGQTLGKIVMKIRVVDALNGAHPGWARLILLRTIVGWVVVGWVILTRFVLTFIGLYVDFTTTVAGLGFVGAYFIIDSLFIFRADHRTIHDLIAGTRVDKIAD